MDDHEACFGQGRGIARAVRFHFIFVGRDVAVGDDDDRELAALMGHAEEAVNGQAVAGIGDEVAGVSFGFFQRVENGQLAAAVGAGGEGGDGQGRVGVGGAGGRLRAVGGCKWGVGGWWGLVAADVRPGLVEGRLGVSAGDWRLVTWGGPIVPCGLLKVAWVQAVR